MSIGWRIVGLHCKLKYKWFYIFKYALHCGDVEIMSASIPWSLFDIREHLNIIGVEDINKVQFKMKEKKDKFVWMEPMIFVDGYWELNHLIMVQ